MPRISYVNGAYQPLGDAAVSIQDRGYQFADGIYEVVVVIDGEALDFEGHLARWRRSLEALHLRSAIDERAMRLIIKRLLRQNRLKDALVYFQATRGVAPRDHPFPTGDIPPSLVITVKPFNLAAADAKAATGVRVITMPDLRWKRVDVKSISLLPNVLAKEAARQSNAAEAWLVDRDGQITEGSSSNAWIIDQAGRLITRPLGPDILGGITRAKIIDVARSLQLAVVERAFTLEDAQKAAEAFITSATSFVTPVIQIDQQRIGTGAPGPVAQRLRSAYKDHRQSA